MKRFRVVYVIYEALGEGIYHYLRLFFLPKNILPL